MKSFALFITRVGIAPVSPITKRFLAGSLLGKLRLCCIAGNWVESSGLTRDRTGSSREPVVKYPGESLGLGIYSKPMRPIQKSVSEPIRVIPNKSEASFNPYQSEGDLISMRTLNPMNPTNPNLSKLSIRMNPKWTGFIRIDISDLFELILNWLRVDLD